MGWVIRTVSPVTHIDLAHLGIGLGHEPVEKQGGKPKNDAKDGGPPFLGRENEGEGKEGRKHDELAVASHEKVRPVRDPMNGHCAKGHLTPP